MGLQMVSKRLQKGLQVTFFSWYCHRSRVARAGAPVSPQSSPPKPLALLRARGLLLLWDSGGGVLSIEPVGTGRNASLLEVGIVNLFANILDVQCRSQKREHGELGK
jgi:hypothetical protein